MNKSIDCIFTLQNLNQTNYRVKTDLTDPSLKDGDGEITLTLTNPTAKLIIVLRAMNPGINEYPDWIR